MAKVPRHEPKANTPTTRKAHHTIGSLEVTGGFLKGAKLEFADGLNCVIGGRGTGKTTVLEFIRYALALGPDEKSAPGRARASKAVVQSNLASGRIRLDVCTKHGMRYRAERAWQDGAQVFNEHGEPTAVPFDRDLIFTADVYGQNEIEEIASNPSFQLALLDKFIEDDLRRVDTEIRKLVRELGENSRELLRLDRAIRDLGEGASEVTLVEEKLKGLLQTDGPDAKLVNAAHDRRALREKERKTLDAFRDDLGKVRTDFGTVVGGLVRRLESRIDDDVAGGPNEEVFSSVGRNVPGLATILKRAATDVTQQVVLLEGVVDDEQRNLAERHAKQDAEYRALVSKSNEESGRANERTALQTRHAELIAAGAELELSKRERGERQTQREELTSTLEGLRDDRFALREKVAERLTEALKPMIRVTVMKAGNRESYRTLLTEALRGQKMQYTAIVDRIVQGASPEELAVAVQRDDPGVLAERTGVPTERCRRVVDALRETEALYALEAIELEDLPRIELLDGEAYKDSTGLSTGQRCTTILPILLLESERPLLIDQPEDNLDNAFIYETVVKSVKGAKGKRQMIFVTHNPNIPVLGDAERVFVLTSDGKQGKLSRAGSVDEVKGEVELLLEGGREAFLLRKQRYGH